MGIIEIIGLFIAALAAAFGIGWRKGGQSNQRKTDAEKAKNETATNKRMDGTPPVDPYDHDNIDQRLREHAGK